jgi:ubiquitin-conjugating enzyme E2 variant
MSQPRDFASGYARSHQIYESVGIVLGVASLAKLGHTLVFGHIISGWWIPLTVFVGLLAADFVSGLVHWGFDTWGSTSTPVVGQLAIRTFREHHVDARAMTKHGFVETNGHNVMLSLIPSWVGVAATHYHVVLGSLLATLVAMSCFFMAACVAMTSQIHKWAHLPPERVPHLVRHLQQASLIINSRHHDRHHERPHDTHYCITVGWMNGPLEAIHFFPAVERLITAITGVQPREEDLAATAEVGGPLPERVLEPETTPLPSEVATVVASSDR